MPKTKGDAQSIGEDTREFPTQKECDGDLDGN